MFLFELDLVSAQAAAAKRKREARDCSEARRAATSAFPRGARRPRGPGAGLAENVFV
jgi:hypothetical protein